MLFNKKRYTLSIAVVLPEIVHMLIWQKKGQDGKFYTLEKLLKSVKGTSAIAINKILGKTGSVWQKESLTEKLRDSAEWQAKYALILVSPVRANMADIPEDYPWLMQKDELLKPR